MRCADTNECVHVSCAMLAGFTVGFEIQSVSLKTLEVRELFIQLTVQNKAKKEPTVTFKNETGVLIPIVTRKPRRLHGLCDTDMSGQVRS